MKIVGVARAAIEGLRQRPWALAAVGLVVLAAFGTGGYYAYRTYDFIEHDNDFCMSCHLMQEPYELFGESAHRGLGCKACHQPNMIERSSMAMAQFIENPDSIRVHAHVPDQRCIACHVEGDPETWRQIANTAGHRVHLESADSTLADIQCVGCHQSSLHEFAAVDRTCAQSGCHTENTINLGAMSALTIHCAACHTFTAPVSEAQDAGAALAALQPSSGECMTCHAMRELVTMPADDPHEGLCSSCHNPHTQETPAQAVETCATGGCHDDAPSLTDYHVGLRQETLDDCSSCHTAHDFGVQGDDCTSCHTEIYDDPGTSMTEGDRVGAVPGASAPGSGFMARHAGLFTESPGSVRSRVASVRRAVWPVEHPAPQSDSVVFRHGEHRDVDCLSCHTTDGSHGRLTVTTLTDCRSCHHTEPVKFECASCHESERYRPATGSRVHTMDFQVRDPVERELPFDHELHSGEECATCHTDQGGLTLSSDPVSCSSCHEEHHEPGNTCRSCHQEAPDPDHPVEQVHVGCSGSGCHTESDFDAVPREREFCLTCHQDMVDHRIEDDRDCAGCHTLPRPRGRGDR